MTHEMIDICLYHLYSILPEIKLHSVINIFSFWQAKFQLKLATSNKINHGTAKQQRL